jgi:hypothetical protein
MAQSPGKSGIRKGQAEQNRKSRSRFGIPTNVLGIVDSTGRAPGLSNKAFSAIQSKLAPGGLIHASKPIAALRSAWFGIIVVALRSCLG